MYLISARVYTNKFIDIGNEDDCKDTVRKERGGEEIGRDSIGILDALWVFGSQSGQTNQSGKQAYV